MWAVRIIVRTGRYQFNGIAPEDSEIAEVLLPDTKIPGIVGITFRAIPELMASQGIIGGSGYFEVVRQSNEGGTHFQFAEQSSDAEQHAARVIADDEHGGISGGLED